MAFQTMGGICGRNLETPHGSLSMSDIRQVTITPAYNDGTYILTWEVQSYRTIVMETSPNLDAAIHRVRFVLEHDDCLYSRYVDALRKEESG